MNVKEGGGILRGAEKEESFRILREKVKEGQK